MWRNIAGGVNYTSVGLGAPSGGQWCCNCLPSLGVVAMWEQLRSEPHRSPADVQCLFPGCLGHGLPCYHCQIQSYVAQLSSQAVWEVVAAFCYCRCSRVDFSPLGPSPWSMPAEGGDGGWGKKLSKAQNLFSGPHVYRLWEIGCLGG